MVETTLQTNFFTATKLKDRQKFSKSRLQQIFCKLTCLVPEFSLKEKKIVKTQPRLFKIKN